MWFELVPHGMREITDDEIVARAEQIKAHRALQGGAGHERQANEYLNQHSASTRYFEIEHVGIPGLQVGDVVTYENSHDYSEPVYATCQVMQMDMDLGNGCMCTTKLKQIN